MTFIKKTYITVFFFLFSLFTSFSCEDKTIKRDFSSVPVVFTKKVLIEEFTGSWCGYCPNGAEILKNLTNSYNVIGVAVHSQDPMEIDHGVFLKDNYPSSGYPSGMVDRVSHDGYVGHNRGYWSWFTEQQLQKSAICGLAINSEVSGENVDIEIRSAFNTEVLIENYRLNVYLVEDNVMGEGYGYDQRNYYNSDSTSIFFNQGDPIVNYSHNKTLRASIFSNSFGGSISVNNMDEMAYVDTFQMNISSYSTKNLKIIAFITHLGESVHEHEVLNVQTCDIDGFQDWD